MPLPLVLWGAAALLAGTGVVKGVGAMNNFDEAKKIGKEAEERHEDAEASLNKQHKKTNTDFEKLGAIKLSVFTNQIKHLIQAIKNSGTDAKSQLSQFDQSFSVEDLKEMESMVVSSLKIEHGVAVAAISSLGGTAISGLGGTAATNATLAWLGGGSLATGGAGMAGGAIALGGIVLSPALAIGGFVLSSKAEGALTKAREYEASVDIAIANIEASEIILAGLSSNAREMAAVLIETAQRFDNVKVNDDKNKKAFEQMLILGKALKNIANTPIMEDDGTASKNIKSKISGYLAI